MKESPAGWELDLKIPPWFVCNGFVVLFLAFEIFWILPRDCLFAADSLICWTSWQWSYLLLTRGSDWDGLCCNALPLLGLKLIFTLISFGLDCQDEPAAASSINMRSSQTGSARLNLDVTENKTDTNCWQFLLGHHAILHLVQFPATVRRRVSRCLIWPDICLQQRPDL